MNIVRNNQYPDNQINRGSHQAKGLIAVIKAIPGRGLLYYNNRTSYARYFPLAAAQSVPGTNEYATWNSIIPNAITTDLGFTALAPWTLLCWGYIFSANADDEYPVFIGRSVYNNEANNQGWNLQTGPNNDGNWGGNIGATFFVNNSYGVYGFNSGVDENVGRYFIGMNLDFDAGGDRRMHINGNLVATEGGDINPASTTGALLAGLDFGTGVVGLIEARFYNYQLSDQQVTQMYSQNREELWEVLRGPSSSTSAAVLNARSQVFVLG